MFYLIDRYMQNITIEDVDKFAKQKGISLSEDELTFTYSFIKKNYKEMISNPSLFDIDRYKNNYSEENFDKIKKVFIEYFSKYHKFL